MEKIIEYDQKLLSSDGAFIHPDGNILPIIYGCHEQFARNYCLGRNYDYLYRLKHDESAWETYVECYNLKKTRDDINIFEGSELTKDKIELYKLWKESCLKKDWIPREMYSDFFTQILGFDKVETIRRYTITTSSKNPHIRLYNYYLMDWHIDGISRLKYDYNKNDFVLDKSYIPSKEDKEAEEEIKDIKTRVLRDERYLFFK